MKVCFRYTESVKRPVNWAHRGAESKRQQDEWAAEEDDGPLQPPESPQHFHAHRKNRRDESEDDDGGGDQENSLMLVLLFTAHAVTALLPYGLSPPHPTQICGEFHRKNKY